MAKPLDKESKFMGVFKVGNVYFLGAAVGFYLVTFKLWATFFGFFTTLILGIVFLSIAVTYIGISNSYPDGFFKYWFNFNTETQVFIPGFEPLAVSKKKGK
jgi:hypothetical protein